MSLTTIIVLIIIFIASIFISYSLSTKTKKDGKGSGHSTGEKFTATKDTAIGELLMFDNGTAEVLQGLGMHCVGCPSHQFETLEQAAAVHGIPTETIVDAINTYLDK